VRGHLTKRGRRVGIARVHGNRSGDATAQVRHAHVPRHQARRGGRPCPPPRRISGGGHASQDATLDDVINEWLAFAKADRSPTTLRGLPHSRENPHFAEARLGSFGQARDGTSRPVLRGPSGSRGRGTAPLAPASVRQAHAVIRRALQQAVRWGWLASNPAAVASQPQLRRQELSAPDPAQVVRLLEYAARSDPDFARFLHLGTTSGSRMGSSLHCVGATSISSRDPQHLACGRRNRQRCRRERYEDACLPEDRTRRRHSGHAHDPPRARRGACAGVRSPGRRRLARVLDGAGRLSAMHAQRGDRRRAWITPDRGSALRSATHGCRVDQGRSSQCGRFHKPRSRG
jgi:hypothetical protein